MPRPGPAREFVGVRFRPDGLAVVRQYAEVETDGNVSEMIRKLVAEAVTARQAKEQHR